MSMSTTPAWAEAMQEIEALQAENKRLREGLEGIAESHYESISTGEVVCKECEDNVRIARVLLGKQDG